MRSTRDLFNFAPCGRGWIAAAGCFALALLLSDCRRPEPQAPVLRAELSPAELRLLLAQVVDDPGFPLEAGILEGQAYKYFLKQAAGAKESKLKDLEDKQASCERLLRQPNLFRGRVVVVRRAVVIEVGKAGLSPEYELPGYVVLPALLVDSARQLFELRILSSAGSDLYEKLKRGIETGKNPVLRVSGYFLKNHAKLTSAKNEPPWRAPLLVAPEPSFERRAGTYDAQQDLEEAHMLKYLPSLSLSGPKAEERLVLEALAVTRAGPRLVIEGRELSADGAADVAKALAALRARLPEAQGEQPSAVVLRGRGTSAGDAQAARRLLQEAGVTRLFDKDENEVLAADPKKPKPESGR